MDLSNGDYDCNFIQPTILTSTEVWSETTTYEEIKTTFITTKTDDFSISTITTVPTIESSSIIIPSSTLNNNLYTTTDNIGSTETDYSTELSSTTFITTENSEFSITSTSEEMEETTSKIPLEIEHTTIVDNKSTDSLDTSETPVSATEPTIIELSTISPFFTDHPTESRHTIDDFSTTSFALEQTTTILPLESTSTTNWDAVTNVSTNNITKGLNCMKTSCHNGGTCMNTSEGSRVSFVFHLKLHYIINEFNHSVQFNIISVYVVLIAKDIYVNRL